MALVIAKHFLKKGIKLRVSFRVLIEPLANEMHDLLRDAAVFPYGNQGKSLFGFLGEAKGDGGVFLNIHGSNVYKKNTRDGKAKYSLTTFVAMSYVRHMYFNLTSQLSYESGKAITMKKTALITLRLPEILKGQLRIAATMESRTMSGQIVHFIERGLRKGNATASGRPPKLEGKG